MDVKDFVSALVPAGTLAVVNNSLCARLFKAGEFVGKTNAGNRRDTSSREVPFHIDAPSPPLSVASVPTVSASIFCNVLLCTGSTDFAGAATAGDVTAGGLVAVGG